MADNQLGVHNKRPADTDELAVGTRNSYTTRAYVTIHLKKLIHEFRWEAKATYYVPGSLFDCNPV